MAKVFGWAALKSDDAICQTKITTRIGQLHRRIVLHCVRILRLHLIKKIDHVFRSNHEPRDSSIFYVYHWLFVPWWSSAVFGTCVFLL